MSVITNIFWNTDQNRLRTGWRFLVYLILFIVITIGRDGLISLFDAAPLSRAVIYLAYLAGGLGLTWLLVRFIDHRPLVDLGFHFDRTWWSDLGFGLALGAFLMTGIFLSMRAAGWLTITGFVGTSTGLPVALAFVLKIIMFTTVAINEELAFRGYQLKNLAEGFAGKRMSTRGAVVLAFLASSALFGLMHLANGNATFFSTLTTICAGLLLSLPYMLTGELGLSIGLHLTWNLFEGNVYGFAVSGTAQSTQLISIDVTGPSLWTGGAYGPEVGLIGLVWALIGCGLILAWNKWLRQNVEIYLLLATYTQR